MVRRHERASFGGAYAFPGGVLEEADRMVASHCGGIAAAEADALLGVSDGLDYFSAAIRELFEESGVLLADIGAADVDLDAVRDGLNQGGQDWGAFVIDNDVALHCGGELTDSCWIAAQDALSARRDGRMAMHFPTIRTLESFAEHKSLDALLSWASARSAAGVPCIFPEIGKRDGKSRVIVGGSDAGALE
jgi:8-oxo-dGTP pyrophosphatase MutT (NUDIX family)